MFLIDVGSWPFYSGDSVFTKCHVVNPTKFDYPTTVPYRVNWMTK